MTAWLFSQLSPQAPGLWLLVSFLALLILLLLWPTLSWRGRRYGLYARWLIAPYLGLLSGGLSPRLMGLSHFDWLVSLSLGLAISFAILGVLLVVRATTLVTQPLEQTPSLISTPREGGRFSIAPYLREAFACGVEEFHWSFLRAATWEILLSLPNPPAYPLYTAVWIGAIIAAVELLVVRHGGSRRLLKLVVIIATTLLFFYTHNFWLCWALHTAAWMILQPVESAPLPRERSLML
ncbi:MAG: hypothetical protein KJZ93_11320 [Caldilineaceae bacterium]|nr:hypothetical protein [Caldilineaceae bacterium]